MRFDDFIRKGFVRKSVPDMSLVKSIIKIHEKELLFLNSLEVTPASSRIILTGYYDALRRILEAIGIKDGYKFYSHKAFIFFLREKGEDTFAIKFDRIRKIRNRLQYEGKTISDVETKECVLEMKRIMKALCKKYLKEIEK